MSLKDLLMPFTAWKNLIKHPVTIKDPVNRQAADRYRGFHKNEIHDCIGCGSCETICQNAAIDLVPVDGIQTKKGDSGLRPRIDYGRCCWCALCVDICTTSSLSMSNEYIWIDNDPEVFRFVPGDGTNSWDEREKGYKRAKEYELLNLKAEHMDEMEPEKRRHSFVEFMLGYTEKQALAEADRCTECGLCVASCPAHMDIPKYISAIRSDDMGEALKKLYNTNPLPETCGRICPQPCADACALSHRGDPIQIRWLKRYIADRIEFGDYNNSIAPKELLENHARVAIVGSGPAGLAAAYYLRQEGVSCTIFDKMEHAGGMMRYGIPEYRMPKEMLEDEINYIKNLGGVEIKLSYELGKDGQLDDLKRDFDAVIVAVGSWKSSSMRTKGEELAIGGIEFLEKIAKNGWSGENPGRTAVIGGGNTAMDCARTSIRLGSGDVNCFYRRTEKQMPAENEEIREAKEEGVNFRFLTAPVKVEEHDGKKILTLMKMELGEPDESGRRRPLPIEGSEFTFEVDTIIAAIGQSTISPEGAKTNKWGDIEVEEVSGKMDGKIFAAGDCVTGPSTVIAAVAGGKKAAFGVVEYLKEEDKYGI